MPERPWPADTPGAGAACALAARAMCCDCGSFDTPLCAQCACLLALGDAAAAWGQACFNDHDLARLMGLDEEDEL